jgi:hypothetical protein
MPKISTYSTVPPTDGDLVLISDASNNNDTKNITLASLKEALFAYTEIYDSTPGEDTIAGSTPIKLVVTTTQGAISTNAGLQQNGLGRVTNVGESRVFAITYSVSIAAQNNNSVEFSLAKNGTVIPHSQTDTITGSGDKGVSVSNTIITTLNTNQYVEVYIAYVGGGTLACELRHLNLVLRQL